MKKIALIVCILLTIATLAQQRSRSNAFATIIVSKKDTTKIDTPKLMIPIRK